MTTATATRVIEIDVRASATAAAQIKQIQTMVSGIEKTAVQAQSKMSTFLDNAATMVKGFAAYFAFEKGVQFIMWLNQLNDETKVMIGRLDQLTTSAAGTTGAFQEIIRITKESGRSMSAVADLYTKVLRQQDQLGITTVGISQITEGFAGALRLSGSSAQEANAAMIQFGQSLASGKMQGDEFRSLLENNSAFMFELAKAAGVTMDALREMSREGEINLNFLREAMFKMGDDGLNMLQRLDRQADKLPLTFKQAMEGVRASLMNLLNAINHTAMQSESIFTKIARRLGENIDMMARVTREKAEIEAARAEAMGKKIEKDPALGQPLGIQRNLEIMKEIANEQKILANLEQLVAKEREKGAAADMKLIERRENLIKASRAEIEMRQKHLDNYAKKEIDLIAMPPIIEGPMPQAEPKPKKPKREPRGRTGGGTRSARDELAELLNDIREADRRFDMEAEGIGKWTQRVNEAARTADTSKASVRQMLDILRESANALDERDKRKREEAERITSGRDAVIVATEQYLKNLEEIDTAYNKLMRSFDEETGEKKLPWQRRLDQLMLDIPKWKTALSPAELANVERVLNWMKDQSEKESIMALFDGTGLDGTTGKAPITEYADTFKNAFERMTDSILQFNKSAKDLIGDFVEDFLRQMARVAMQRAMAPALNAAMDWITSTIAPALPQANGGVWSNGVQMFENGGIVSQPTSFQHAGGYGVMGEAGTEAIMPLKRGADGKLGVGATPVTVNIYNNSKATATATETTNSKGEREILVMIEETVENGLTSGRYDKAMRQSFDVTRTGR